MNTRSGAFLASLSDYETAVFYHYRSEELSAGSLQILLDELKKRAISPDDCKELVTAQAPSFRKEQEAGKDGYLCPRCFSDKIRIEVRQTERLYKVSISFENPVRICEVCSFNPDSEALRRSGGHTVWSWIRKQLTGS